MMIAGNIYGGEWEFQASEIPGVKIPQDYTNFIQNMHNAVYNMEEVGLNRISEFAFVNEDDIKGRFYGCYEPVNSSKMTIAENLSTDEIEQVKEIVDEIYFN